MVLALKLISVLFCRRITKRPHLLYPYRNSSCDQALDAFINSQPSFPKIMHCTRFYAKAYSAVVARGRHPPTQFPRVKSMSSNHEKGTSGDACLDRRGLGELA